MIAPMVSPWGKVQHCEELCEGVVSVSTASHGGVMAKSSIVGKFFSRPAQKCGFWDRGWLCFEEDCDASVALCELMDKGLYSAPVNEHFGPGEYSECIASSVQRFHPEYWQARERGLTRPGGQIKQTDKECER